MKKIIVSAVVAVMFVAYVIYQRTQVSNSSNPGALAAINSANTSQTIDTSLSSNPVNTNANSAGTSPRGTSSNSNTSSSNTNSNNTNSGGAAKGKYKNGTYTGTAADAYYGNVQVKVTISGGKLTAIEFLQYPNDRAHSVEINNYALPQLRQEAIASQSAQVDIVSGATDSSQAFIQSLSSALSQAA